MLVTESRPRNLKWFHAGPLLYGDWGTSRLYVLGLAFFFTAHASVLFLAAISVLMVAVAWAYTIVCRSFPDGGGVYTAARQLNPTWSVLGATLLIGGYIITVAISVIEAFHYFGVAREWVLPVSVGTIALLGGVNWLGSRSAGRFALVVAIAALVVSGLIALACLPFFFRGLDTISLTGLGPPGEAWVHFTRICLALSGVEAVANMTGLMRRPVSRTSKRTIWPVLAEVLVLNMLFGIALAGLPGLVDVHTAPVHGDVTEEVVRQRDTAMNLLAGASAERWLGVGTASTIAGALCAGVFGLLLLSAGNTAVMATVSVLYAMGQDRELPRAVTKLNFSGVPWVGLAVACGAPAAVLLVTQDVAVLAELYVIGVFGAITTSVMAVAMNGALKVSRGERIGLWALGAVLTAISLTIVVTTPRASIFAAGLMVTALAVRMLVRSGRRAEGMAIEVPERGWMAELRERPTKLDADRPRIMLAARGRYQSEFAVDLARRRKGILFAIFVRTIRVMDLNPGALPRLENDPDAQQALGTTAVLAHAAGVPFVPIYVTATDVAEEILDATVTYACDTLIMGKSKRSVVSRKVEGDVVSQVAKHLPDGVALITRAADKPHAPGTGPTPPEAEEADESVGHA